MPDRRPDPTPKPGHPRPLSDAEAKRRAASVIKRSDNFPSDKGYAAALEALLKRHPELPPPGKR